MFMAVIEELVAKLGFDVDGLPKLKAAVKQFDTAKKAIVASANPLKAAGASATVAAVGVGRLGETSKKSSRGVLLLSTALGGLKRAAAVAISGLRIIVAIALRAVSVFAGLAAGIAVVALAFTRAAAKAALARREFSLAAKEIGTSAQNLETVGNILRVAGFGDGFEEEAKKVVGAMEDVAKAVRKGGDDADEAKKKFKGFGIDKAFEVDPKTGKTRDSAALALDVFQAYKRATEQAGKLRAEADKLGSKTPKKAAALRKKALEQDRKSEQFAEDAGISGKLKVLLDSIALKDLPGIIKQAARLFPTTSDKSEQKQSDVAEQARQAGLKFDAIIKGIGDRLTEIGMTIAEQVLPTLNSFLGALVAFGKRFKIIDETVDEKRGRESNEAAKKRAEAMRAERSVNDLDKTDTPAAARARTQFEQNQRDQSRDRDRFGTPMTAPRPPERPKDGLPGRDGKDATEAKRALPARDKDRTPAPEPRGLPARDKDTSPAPRDTPTRRVRDTQAGIPERLEALKRSLEGLTPKTTVAPEKASEPKPKVFDPAAFDRLVQKLAKEGTAPAKPADSPAPAATTPEFGSAVQQFKSIVDSIPRILQQVSPETNANKMQKAIENKTENDNRTYSDIGNDHRTISPSITVNATGLDAVAAAVKNSVLGAVSTKGSNTSTGALTAP
jgi:hypothetical protein